MEQTPQNKRNNREFIVRIAVCAVAVLALSAAITFMIRGILLDSNATKRLIAQAFMSYDVPKETDPDTEPQTTSPSVPDTEPEESPDIQGAQSVSIVAATLSSQNTAITNYTSYAVDENALQNYKFGFYAYSASPLVLILHSHADECYAPDGASAVNADFNFENRDPKENIFAVGEAIAEVLTATGIGVIHSSEDASDMEATIKRYLKEYPSIRFVLDVHRDGIYTTDGRIVKTNGSVADTPAAELMLAVGTNAANGGSDWQGNLAAAYRVSELITSAEKNIMRKILLRPESLGQQVAPCSLSLYVGSTGNTLSEALTSARFFARYYAIFILSAVD